MLKKIHRITSVLLASMLIVLLISTSVQATQSEELLTESCYMASSVCPEEYMNFAEENASDFVLSVDENLQDCNITIGTPFSFATANADVYYFPIICDNAIRYLFRVYPTSNGFSGAITAFLASDIEMLSHLTTPETPLYLQLIGTKIIATIGEDEYILFEYPENMAQETSTAFSSSNESFTVINAKQSIDMPLYLHNTISARVSQRASIMINKDEVQGNNSWCAAYCLASIIRTRTSHTNIYAMDCMRDAFGYVPSTSVAFPRSKMASVAQKYGLYPTVSESLAMDSVLYSQIESGRPVIQSMENFGGTKRHAVVLRGYNLVNSTWGIWNPWFSDYEWYSMSGEYIPTGYQGTNSNTYLPYRHAYNF